LRAKKAGFDIIYCYAGHGLTLAMQFLMRRTNDRNDEYGGSLVNRVRFLRELIEDTKEAVGDTCAVALRMAIDEMLGESGITHQGEGHDIVAMLAELPDLWDVNVSGWSNDSATSRFEKEGFQEKYISFVKKLTTKPVVGVGRYTSPDSMVSAIRRGVVDLIGSARPSIADPFLPMKIKENRPEDIRECIGCNICVTGDTRIVPIRCTQNPAMGEEWRRDWHPESIAIAKTKEDILIVGAGPSGLECARALGQRGYSVTVVDSRREPGGRVVRECALPGLNEWRRVIDWRLTQINKLKNVSFFPSSKMNSDDILETGIENVIIAAGSEYRRDGMGRSIFEPIPGCHLPHVFTPDDILGENQKNLSGKVLIYDDDHYYMGGALAEMLQQNGCEVTYITPSPMVSYWTQFSLEQEKIEKKLLHLGIRLYTRHTLINIETGKALIHSTLGDHKEQIEIDNVVLVSDRVPNDALYNELLPAIANGKLKTLGLIGDAEAPGIIASAVFSGHLAARNFGEIINADETPFKIERVFPNIQAV
ncbi:MAG: FAD-dependent oxidoreductase, partial [Chloroflexota bacterium]